MGSKPGGENDILEERLGRKVRGRGDVGNGCDRPKRYTGKGLARSGTEEG